MLVTMTGTSSDDEQEQAHDLSPYELLRLEKIRRNQAKLEALGLGSGSIGTLAGVAPKKKKVGNKQQKKRSRSTNADRRRQQPTRSSQRLRDIKETHSSPTSVSSNVHTAAAAADINTTDNVAKEEEDDGPQVIDYDYLPKEPDELDDDEFQVYTSLRAWRLRRKNELEVEPYKICQNRTLCELIRRVRNDPSWGALVVAAEGEGGLPSEKRRRSEEDVAADLIECWGLGPSKVAGDGFGPEMMAVIAEEKNCKLLKASRAQSSQSSDDAGTTSQYGGNCGGSQCQASGGVEGPE